MVTINPRRAQACGLSTYSMMKSLLWQRLPISEMLRNSDRFRIRFCFLNGTAITPAFRWSPQKPTHQGKGVGQPPGQAPTPKASGYQVLIFYGKPFAAFGTPAIDKGATAFGRHALEKAMGARTLDSAWLVCTFHCLQPSIFGVGGDDKKISRKVISGVEIFTIGY